MQPGVPGVGATPRPLFPQQGPALGEAEAAGRGKRRVYAEQPGSVAQAGLSGLFNRTISDASHSQQHRLVPRRLASQTPQLPPIRRLRNRSLGRRHSSPMALQWHLKAYNV